MAKASVKRYWVIGLILVGIAILVFVISGQLAGSIASEKAIEANSPVLIINRIQQSNETETKIAGLETLSNFPTILVAIHDADQKFEKAPISCPADNPGCNSLGAGSYLGPPPPDTTVKLGIPADEARAAIDGLSLHGLGSAGIPSFEYGGHLRVGENTYSVIIKGVTL